MSSITGGRRIISPAVFIFGLLAASTVHSQVDENQLGAWYSYSLNKAHDNSRWGTHVDWSYRTFEVVDDFRQFILRGGMIYRPESGNAVTPAADQSEPFVLKLRHDTDRSGAVLRSREILLP